jgi:hypothetical protein
LQGAGGPKSEFLRSQSREQRTLEFKEAVFHGWKAPPRSDYKKEDIEFMERCEVRKIGGKRQQHFAVT